MSGAPGDESDSEDGNLGVRARSRARIEASIRKAAEEVFGTQKGGLNKFIRNNGQFKRYKMMDGLPSDFISDILEDDSGYLWISTDAGLLKFNPKAESFRNYDAEDGLQSNAFEPKCCYKSTKPAN